MSIARITKCLALTTSDQDGEALAAIRTANLLREKLGRTWEEMLQPASAAAGLDTTNTHALDWPLAFNFIREWNPPLGRWADFLNSIESQFRRTRRLTPKQRRAVLKFYTTAAEKKSKFEEVH